MKKILHKLTYAQNRSQYEAHPSYYEEILCKVLTVRNRGLKFRLQRDDLRNFFFFTTM